MSLKDKELASDLEKGPDDDHDEDTAITASEEEDELLDEGGPDDDDEIQPALVGAAAAGSAKTPAGGANSAQHPQQHESTDEITGNALIPIAVWITISGAVILFNKYLYSSDFPYPLSLTAIHMVFTSLVTMGLKSAGALAVPDMSYDFYLRSVLPIGFLYALSLGFSNLAAHLLTVSFVQMIKALMPLTTLVVSVLLRMESPSFKQAGILLVLTAGVAIASYGELLMNVQGLIFQLAAVVSEAVRLVLTQKILQQHMPKGASALVAVAMLAPMTALFLLPVAAVSEGAVAFEALTSSARVLALVAANTLVAFALNIAVIWLVKRTSGLALTLSGVVKDVLLIVLSLFVFRNPVTHTQLVGYYLALYGLNLHDVYRAQREAGMWEIIRTASTNKRMLAISVGVAVLFGIATTRLHMDHWDEER